MVVADRRPRFRATESRSSHSSRMTAVYLEELRHPEPSRVPPDPAGIYIAGADGSTPAV